MVRQEIIEDGTKRTLQEFSDLATKYLKEHPECDEVVQLADNICELETDRMTRPENVYQLPGEFHYYFSGFFGQVIGVGRPDLVH